MIISIFDWDDTLMSSSYIEEHEMEMKGKKLPQLSESIKNLINKALEHGYVYIVTNAQKEWVNYCINTYLVGCEEILEKVRIVSTADCGLSNTVDLESRKAVMFSLVCSILSHRTKMNHLLCFGDCDADRIGALTVREKIEKHTFVKNIKFMSRPSLQTLLLEQEICLYSFPVLLEEKHLDLVLSAREHSSPTQMSKTLPSPLPSYDMTL